MIHPYAQAHILLPMDKLNWFEMTLELCTTFKGKPFGPAVISFTHDINKSLSFRGLGTFNEEGVLSNGPFFCIET
jgi:hypothetical protein